MGSSLTLPTKSRIWCLIILILVFHFPYIATVAVGIGPGNVRLPELFKQGQVADEAILALRKSFLGGFIPQTNGQPYELGKKAKKKYSLFSAVATIDSGEGLAYRQAVQELMDADGKYDIMKVAKRRDEIATTLLEFPITRVKIIPVDPSPPQQQLGNLAGLFDKALSSY